MRVMFISHASDLYGAPRSLLDLIDGLILRGVECCVVLPGKGPFIGELEKRNLKCYVIPFSNWIAVHKTRLRKLFTRNLLSALGSVSIALKALSWKADIIYTNTSVIFVGALAALLARRPHIWHVREFGQEDFGFFFQCGNRRSMRLIGRLSFRVLVVSKALRQKYLQYVPAEKLQAIYDAVRISGNPVSPPKSKHGTQGRRIPVLAIVGRLQHSKGQMDAVLAVAELVRRGIKVKLRIVGDGRPRYIEQLEQAIAQNGIRESVELTGHIGNPIPVMKESDAILVCSHSEAFGRVTVEGMLSGKPVIGARSGATPELVNESFNGLLYETGNHVDLADKIAYLIEHPIEAACMGRRGLEWASKEFAIERSAAQVYSVLQDVMKRRHHRT